MRSSKAFSEVVKQSNRFNLTVRRRILYLRSKKIFYYLFARNKQVLILRLPTQNYSSILFKLVFSEIDQNILKQKCCGKTITSNLIITIPTRNNLVAQLVKFGANTTPAEIN